MEERLWSHALVIAHGIDKETWNEVVTKFIGLEFDPAVQQQAGSAPSSQTVPHAFDALKVAYGMFAGFGVSAGELSASLQTQ